MWNNLLTLIVLAALIGTFLCFSGPWPVSQPPVSAVAVKTAAE